MGGKYGLLQRSRRYLDAIRHRSRSAVTGGKKAPGARTTSRVLQGFMVFHGFLGFSDVFFFFFFFSWGGGVLVLVCFAKNPFRFSLTLATDRLLQDTATKTCFPFFVLCGSRGNGRRGVNLLGGGGAHDVGRFLVACFLSCRLVDLACFVNAHYIFLGGYISTCLGASTNGLQCRFFSTRCNSCHLESRGNVSALCCALPAAGFSSKMA